LKQAKPGPHYRLRIHRALEVQEVAAPGKQKLPVIRPMVYSNQFICAGQVLDGTSFARDRG